MVPVISAIFGSILCHIFDRPHLKGRRHTVQVILSLVSLNSCSVCFPCRTAQRCCKIKSQFSNVFDPLVPFALDLTTVDCQMPLIVISVIIWMLPSCAIKFKILYLWIEAGNTVDQMVVNVIRMDSLKCPDLLPARLWQVATKARTEPPEFAQFSCFHSASSMISGKCENATKFTVSTSRIWRNWDESA